MSHEEKVINAMLETIGKKNDALVDLHNCQQEIEALRQENARLRADLQKIARPALGGKQQQYLAQQALAEEGETAE